MKKFSTKALMRGLAWLMCAMMLAGAVLPVLVSAASTNNIARGKRAIACHSETADLVPSKALDGNTGTRFAAGPGCNNNTWFIVDLEDSYDLEKVRINWEAAHPSKYVIEVSDDDKTYTELATVSASNNAGWVETALSGTGRFLRIRELSRVLDSYGFSIWELEVFGQEASADNSAAYDQVYASSIKDGSISFSDEGFVKRGTEVTLTLTPMVGGKLSLLTLNGKDITDQVKDNKYSFTVDGDEIFTAEFGTPPREKYECENAIMYSSKNAQPSKAPSAKDDYASGGAVAGVTGSKYFLFENVMEANCVQVAYASTNTNTMALYVRYPWEDSFHSAGYIPFSTTNGWAMNSAAYIAVSPAAYIPEGSDIVISPNVDCNLDCLWLTKEVFSTPDKAPANTLPAAKLSDNTTDDFMATYGDKITLTANKSIEFTVPDAEAVYNILNLSYCAEESATAELRRGSDVLVKLSLSKTALRTFEGTGMRTENYSSGETLTFVCTSGEIALDYLAFVHADEAEAVRISDLPENGERLTVDLDGYWEVDSEEYRTWTLDDTVPEDLTFINTIPVPGLWNCAALDLGNYSSSKMWFKKTIILDEEPDTQILLSIGSAQYGRYFYVNGEYIGCHEYNYSASTTDLTGLLHKGENELVILLGSWNHQSLDKNCKAHILGDGESRYDEPGITDSVSLIFNQEPSVSAVQTAPDIDNGKVKVQVTLSNNSNAAVTSDVVVSVYELGIFTNGVADREETKVGEFTKSAVKVDANGTATFIIDSVELDGWSRDKCWSPDNPFLYRVEIKTSGDTYSTRFGMRTFDFDPVTKYARLNGEIIFLSGTNVAIGRYMDDPLCGTTPWDEDWLRKLYSEYKETNWDVFRTHLGHANSKWFEIADEMGFMIFDEYPIWGGDVCGCTIKTMLPELYSWIDARGNHPSLVVFDAQNEAVNLNLTTQMCTYGKEYDLQKRTWDNGWSAPIDENSPIECHPYFLNWKGVSGIGGAQYSKPQITMADLGITADMYPNNPFILNEHGEIWLCRDGVPTTGSAIVWDTILPNSTPEEKLAYYAEIVSAQMEAFRAGRAYSGVFFFNGLASSFPDHIGVTSDIFMPDVSSAETLEIRPYTKELLKNAFADLGIVIEQYAEKVKRGAKISIPVTLVNDTGKDISDLPVTVVILSGDRETVLNAESFNMSVSAFSADSKGLSTNTVEVTVPSFKDYCDNGDVVYAYAYYELDGEAVYSQRKWTVNGGSTTSDDALPTYDWLERIEPPVTTTPESDTTEEPSTDTAEPEDSTAITDVTTDEPIDSSVDVTEAPAEDAPTDEATTEVESSGCKSSISVLGAIAATAGAAALIATKKKKED